MNMKRLKRAGCMLWAAACLALSARAASVNLGWSPVTANADGSPFVFPGAPAPDELVGYRIFHATYSLLSMTTAQAMSSASVVKTAVGLSTASSVSGLADGASYYFRLAARDVSGNQSGFNVNGGGLPVEVLIFTPPPAPPTAPGTPVLTALTDTQIRLDWADATGETVYRLERSLDGVSFSTVTGSLAANAVTTTDTGLTASTLYYYRVVARNGAGETMSGVASATTQAPPATPPAVPSGLMQTYVSTDAVTFSWNAVSGSDGFDLEFAQDSGFGVLLDSVSVPASVTIMDIDELSPATTFYFRLRAFNSAGASEWVERSFVTNPASASGSGFTPPAGLKEAYAYPNPAVGSDPVIRAFMGGVDWAEVTIFDQAGKAVHSGRTTAAVVVNGETAFEYRWMGEKAPGVYYAVIHGKKGSETIRARAKFAVIR